TPLRTYENSTYRTVQTTSDPRMPMGMSRLGFFVSCAAVDTASNPMNAKNTTPAAPRIPMMPPYWCVTPSGVTYGAGAGIQGVWFAGRVNPQPNTTTITPIDSVAMTLRLCTNAD